MKRKIISLLLAACMLVGLLPVGQVRANAADETATSGTCGENLTWTFDEDGTLTISGTGKMDDYTYSDTFTYDSNSPWHSLTIKTVVLTDGVTNIGNYAFYRCKSLSSVSIPDSVTTIGGSAFYDCNSISQENCTYMSIQTSSQIYNVVPYDVTLQQSSTNTSRQLESASTSAFIIASMNTNCTISNSKGQQLILKDGEISTDSTMHVINYHVIIESENPQWYIEVPDSEQFFITEATDNIQVGIYNKNYFLSFESDGFVQDDTLVYIIGSGINVQKSDDSAYNFTAYVSSDELINPNETALYSISGTASGNTSISVDESDISAESDGSLDDVNAYVYADINHAKTQGEDAAPFLDVQNPDLYYYLPVNWAAENNIAAGVGAHRFSPNQSCTRAQLVSFLWRAAGEPEPETTKSPFTDVQNPNEYYYKAVLWAAENGIAAGVGNNQFAPNQTCTRAQIVSFIYRASGDTETYTENPFQDVSPKDYYYKAVLWGAANGVVAGTSDTTFSPDETCTRAQGVSFLYRSNGLY